MRFMEKKLIKLVILFCATMYATTSLFAQSLSPYEQKRYDLANQTATEIIMEVPELGIMMGMSVKKTDFEDKYEEMDFFENLIESVGMSAIYAGSVDYQSYKVKEIYKTWTERRRELDKTRTKADEEREIERKKKKEIVLPQRGTKARLLHSIKEDFEKWAEKGEFEKTSELMVRYRDYGINIFDSICLLYTCGKYSIALSTEATDIDMKYDADEESYTMTFIYGERNASKTIIGKGAVPIAFAKKQQFENLVVTALRIVDGLIIPKEIQITFGNDETNERFTSTFFFDSIPGEKQLTVCFSEIRFDGNVPAELLTHCINPGILYNKKKTEHENYVNASIDSIVAEYAKAKEHYLRLVNSYDNLKQTLTALMKRLPYRDVLHLYGNFDDYLDRAYDTYRLNSGLIEIHASTIRAINPSKIETELYSSKDVDRSIVFHQRSLAQINGMLDGMDTAILNLCQNNANSIFREYIFSIYRQPERYNSVEVESVTFDGNMTIFRVKLDKWGKDNFQGDFNASNKIFLVSFEGKDFYYTRDDIITTSSGDMYLRIEKTTHFDDTIIRIALIKNNSAYKLSPEATNAIVEHGLFKQQ